VKRWCLSLVMTFAERVSAAAMRTASLGSGMWLRRWESIVFT